MSSETEKRPYRLKRRAEAQEATRRRIAEAAVGLHGSVGFVATSISAVAERAGVQRATVYRHFPDEPALLAACSAHWDATHPAPDPGTWAAIDDPEERLRAALAGLYAWYRDGEEMLANVLRDAPHVPALQEHVAGLQGLMAAVEAMLLERRGLRGARRPRVAAALGHALDFHAWRSLAGRGLEDGEVVELMVALVAAASR